MSSHADFLSSSSNTHLDSDEDLPRRAQQLRKLHSAWSLLAPAGLGVQANKIAETGRAFTDHLTAIVKSKSDVSPTALQGIDNQLSDFETSIRRVAEGLSVSQIRASLPLDRTNNRQGLLDLLDVLIGPPNEASNSVRNRIPTLDHLITLLCTRPDSDSGAIGFDPVTLTSRMQELTVQADDPEDPHLAEVEAEFFAAANLDTEGLREELQIRRLQRRKTELGMAFFAPRVLRAIVTYNAVLLARVNDEILDSSAWGEVHALLPNARSAASGRTSAFESSPLLAVAEAVRRRAGGESARQTATDRMAWALDFEYLEECEAEALRSEKLATIEDPLGAAILIGLLNRSIVVLSIELQEAGLSPDEIADDWVDEIATVFQEEINRYISEDAYKVACALSELKNKFLIAPFAEQLRVQKSSKEPFATRHVPRSVPPPPSAKAESARNLVQEILNQDLDARSTRNGSTSWQQIPWARVGKLTSVATLLLVTGMLLRPQGNPDLDQMSTEQLAIVSPYLVGGERDGMGTGPSFVGVVDQRWLSLPSDQQVSNAKQIVSQLRAQGMQQIMIYDGNRQIRVQAIGSQPTLTL